MHQQKLQNINCIVLSIMTRYIPSTLFKKNFFSTNELCHDECTIQKKSICQYKLKHRRKIWKWQNRNMIVNNNY